MLMSREVFSMSPESLILLLAIGVGGGSLLHSTQPSSNQRGGKTKRRHHRHNKSVKR